MSDPVLILLTKKPLPGFVKTRLLPNCSAETAADIAFEMIADTIETVTDSWRGQVKLSVAPDTEDRRLKQLTALHSIEMGAQPAGDLGEKMQSLICRELNDAPSAAVMGCDIPTIDRTLIEYAFQQMNNGANVLGPSADGGFYFLGLNNCYSEMMKGIHWGTESVLQSLKSTMKHCKIYFDVVLPCQQDVDTWSDFVYISEIFPRYQKFACGKFSY